MKTIEKIIKVFPLITFLVIVASSIKLAVYYGVFQVNIVEYLSVTEYLPLFIDDLHIVLSISASLLLGFVSGVLTQKKSKKKDNNEDIIGNKKLRIGLIIFIFIILIYVPLAYFFIFRSMSEWLDSLIGLFFFFMILIFMIGMTFDSIDSFVSLVWIILLAIGPLILSAYRDAYLILDNRGKVSYEIKIKEGEIRNLRYIGKSNQYLFLFDNTKGETVIYPINRLKEIRIRELD